MCVSFVGVATFAGWAVGVTQRLGRGRGCAAEAVVDGRGIGGGGVAVAARLPAAADEGGQGGQGQGCAELCCLGQKGGAAAEQADGGDECAAHGRGQFGGGGEELEAHGVAAAVSAGVCRGAVPKVRVVG